MKRPLYVALGAILALLCVAGAALVGAGGLPQSGGELYIPVGRYQGDSGLVLWVGMTTTPGATETATNAPSATSTPIYTQTPSETPTATPEPPTATATPEFSPTPTQETTPLPTVTPDYPKQCELKVLVDGLRRRGGPGTSFPYYLPNLADGTAITVDQFQAGAPYLWARLVGHTAGDVQLWSAVRWNDTWWVDGHEGTSETCVDVPGWPEGLEPPEPIVLWPTFGLHILLGAEWEPLEAFGIAEKMGTAKALSMTGWFGPRLLEANPDIVLVYRSLYVDDLMRDCPYIHEWFNADLYYEQISRHWPPGWDYYEIMNECPPPGADDFEWMVEFHIDLAERAAADGRCILAFSFPPGNPLLEYWDVLAAYIEWAAEHPCGVWPDGTPKYHGLALHQTGYMAGPYWPQDPDSWINNPWIAGRDIKVNAQLAQDGHMTLDTFPGPVFLTEWGYTDGYSGNWSQTFSCEEIAAGVKESLRQYKSDHPWITGAHLWTYGDGGGGQWSSVEACVETIGLALG